MSEQKEREQIEKRHAKWEAAYASVGATPPRAHKDRGTLLSLLQERDEQIEQLRRFLKDNDEKTHEAWRNAERLRLEMALRKADADLSLIRARRARAWKRCAKKMAERVRESEARAGRAEKELARFQRADVGERVRQFSSRRPTGIVHGDDFLDLIDICRQQAAEIERLTEHAALEAEESARHIWYRDQRIAGLEATAAGRLVDWDDVKRKLDRERMRSAAWKRCAKKWRHDHKIDTAQLDRDIAELQDELHAALEDATEQQNKRYEAEQRLRAYEGLRARIEGLPGSDAYGNAMAGAPVLLVRDTVMAALNEDAPTDKHDRVDAGAIIEDEPPSKEEVLAGVKRASEEEFRPAGQVPLALRAVHEVWEDGAGDIVHDWAGTRRWQERPVRPRGARWSEVEQAAAAALGAEGAKAGRERMEDYQLAKTLHGGRLAGSENRAAYRAAYDAAKGG